MLNAGLGFVFTARDLASTTMGRVERQFATLEDRVTGGAERMKGAFRQAGVGIATFTAGALGVASGLKLAGAAGEFEQGLAAVGAVTRATTRELQLLRAAAVQAGIDTQFSPSEAIAGLLSLATAGQTAEDATRTLVPVLDLAAGSLGQLGVAQAAEAVVGTLNSYGMAAEQAAGVTDKLLRVTQLTNFQTRDFGAGLATAAATGAIFGQSLDEVLVAMGLIRNANIDASSAATGFGEAVRRLGADSNAQQAVAKAGVRIFDAQSGNMRSVIDVMTDFAHATRGMSEQERNRHVVTAFGVRGLKAFNAVMNAQLKITRDGREVILEGAEAIATLRDQMSGAEGTAAEFRDALLDTFQGQKTLLGGTLQTLAVVLGEPFAAVFKPIVGALVDGLNAVLRAFQALPGPVKRVFAGVVVAVGGFFMLVGAVITVKAAVALLGIAFKALGVTLGGLMAALAPAILLVGALGAAFAGLYVAFRRNLGGITDAAFRFGQRIRLLVRGLTQLFEQGGFSGAVREELARAENQGLKRFLITTWQVLHRIRRIWTGFKEGFVATIEGARPVFHQLAAALSDLGSEIAGIFAAFSGGAASLPSEEFRNFGAVAGAAIATVVKWLVALVTIPAELAAGFAAGFRSMIGYIQPAIALIGEALAGLRKAWNALVGVTDDSADSTRSATSAFRTLGVFLGKVFGGVVTAIALGITGLIKILTEVIRAAQQIKDAFVTVGTAIGETVGAIYLWFTQTLPDAARAAYDGVVGVFSRIVSYFEAIGRWIMGVFDAIAQGIKSFLMPVVDFFRGVGRALKRVFNAIRDFVIKLLRRVPSALLPSRLERFRDQPLSTEIRESDEFEAIGRTEESAARAQAASSPMPAAAETGVVTSEMAQWRATVAAMAAAQARQREQAAPVSINVQVDGETIAHAVHDANTDAATRAFSPVPAY